MALRRDRHARAKEFITAYRDAYGTAPDSAFPALGYDAARLLLDVLRRAQSRREIFYALEHTEGFKGVTGTISFNRMRLLKLLNDGGVKILLGSDAPQRFSVPGFSIHREMKRMADSGMRPYDIVRSGTYNVGLYLKDKDNFGTIEVGKRADMILLDANPLEDIGNIALRSGVMVRGRWLAEREIQSRLDKIAASHR